VRGDQWSLAYQRVGPTVVPLLQQPSLLPRTSLERAIDHTPWLGHRRQKVRHVRHVAILVIIFPVSHHLASGRRAGRGTDLRVLADAAEASRGQQRPAKMWRGVGRPPGAWVIGYTRGGDMMW
jgi:hypothetical protein